MLESLELIQFTDSLPEICLLMNAYRCHKNKREIVSVVLMNMLNALTRFLLFRFTWACVFYTN